MGYFALNYLVVKDLQRYGTHFPLCNDNCFLKIMIVIRPTAIKHNKN